MPLTTDQRKILDKIKYDAHKAKLDTNLLDKLYQKIIASHYDLDELEKRLEEIRIVRKRIEKKPDLKPLLKQLIHFAQITHTRITVEKKYQKPLKEDIDASWDF